MWKSGTVRLPALSSPAPCTPANVAYQYSCGTGIAFVNWDETLGRNSFSVEAHSGNHTASCSTSDGTDCYLPSLLCSRMYHVEVRAVADSCSSSAPGVTQIRTGKNQGDRWGHHRPLTPGVSPHVTDLKLENYVQL